MEAEGRGSGLLAAWNLSGWLATAPAAGDRRDDFWRAGQLCGWAGSSTGDGDVAMQDETVSLPRRVVFLSSYVDSRIAIPAGTTLLLLLFFSLAVIQHHRRQKKLCYCSKTDFTGDAAGDVVAIISGSIVDRR
jgi:hypothetical protein